MCPLARASPGSRGAWGPCQAPPCDEGPAGNITSVRSPRGWRSGFRVVVYGEKRFRPLKLVAQKRGRREDVPLKTTKKESRRRVSSTVFSTLRPPAAEEQRADEA